MRVECCLKLLALATSVAALQQAQYVLQDDLNALQQPGAGAARGKPDRPLPWAQLNVLATTDTHGWLRGHTARAQPESAFSGDWGDFYSFVHHMREESDRRKVDLLLVDSGDLHDGNGLVDADDDIKGTAASIIMNKIPYDLMTVGNHELYNYTIALDFYERFYPILRDRYLASNVFILPRNSKTPVRFGAPFKRFVTRQQNLRVLAFGTLFHFTWSAKEVHVQPISSMVKEEWFLDELSREPVDVIILIGHVPASSPEWKTLQHAVRRVLPNTPILIFGGHEHIRDCQQLDLNSMTLASGRYFETVGFMSLANIGSETPMFERRYLDNNRRTYEYHTRDFAPDFDTWTGLDISTELTRLYQRFQLSHTFGISPHTFYRTRYPVEHPRSVYNLLLERIIPALIVRKDRPQPRAMFILNSGSVRFDIGKGPFTVDSQSLVFPFINRNLYFPDVPIDVAAKLLKSMNEIGEYSNSQAISTKPSYGYVTKDRCPGIGDDTLHSPLPYIEPATFLATTSWNQSAEHVDVAFFDFISLMVVDALNRVQNDRKYAVSDIQIYTNRTSDNLLAMYAQQFWN